MRNKLVLLVALVVLVAAGLYWKGEEPSMEAWQTHLVNQDIDAAVADVDFSSFDQERIRLKMNDARARLTDAPEDSWTWVVVGNLFSFVEEHEKALFAYERALEFEQSISAALNIATLQRKEFQDYEKAEEYYRMALTFDKEYFQAYLDLAQMFEFNMDRADKVLPILDEGLTVLPQHPDLLIAKIAFHKRQGNIEEMKELIRELFEAYPSNETYRNQFESLLNI